ncbi:MAG: DUF2284 domain-containing protein [Candidatus Anammoxibacter sp.]
MSKNSYDSICKMALEKGARLVKVIDVNSIAVEPWVQWKCRFGCPRHGKSKTCPPFAPDYKETGKILDSYSTAILIEGEPPGKKFNEMIVKLENEANFAGYYKAFALGAGPCPLCSECNIDEPCRNPSLARPSMEACGIDVFKTVRDNGFEVNFLKHKNTYVKYFGLILVE